MSVNIFSDAYVYELSLGDKKSVVRSYKGSAVEYETFHDRVRYRFYADDIIADIPKVMEPLMVYRSNKWNSEDLIFDQKLFVLVLEKNNGFAINKFKDYLTREAESAVSTAQRYLNYISKINEKEN